MELIYTTPTHNTLVHPIKYTWQTAAHTLHIVLDLYMSVMGIFATPTLGENLTVLMGWFDLVLLEMGCTPGPAPLNQ